MRKVLVAFSAFWLGFGGSGCVERLITGHEEFEANSGSGGVVAHGSSSGSGSSSGDFVCGETDLDAVEFCAAPRNLSPCDEGVDDPFKAIGLGCPGDSDSAIAVRNTSFTSPDARAWRVISQYGTHIDETDGLPTWRPREGDSMLAISTGVLPQPDAVGRLTQTPGNGGENLNPDELPLPLPISAAPGSNGGQGGTPFEGCDGVGDCSDSLFSQWVSGQEQASDLLWFQFETQAPSGTYGFAFDFAYFSAEFPEWVDSNFNDIFVVWSNSESYTGNLCFVNDRPCTVTALWPPRYPQGSAALNGTLFESAPVPGEKGTTQGEATGWYAAHGSAVPGEFVQLTFAIFDTGDTIYDTLVLLDNFRWHCDCCTAPDYEPCIGIDPVPE